MSDPSSYEKCLSTAKIYGGSLKFVPDHWKTPELCLAAVSSNGLALQFVPTKLRSVELCKAAVDETTARNARSCAAERFTGAMQFVPQDMRSRV